MIKYRYAYDKEKNIVDVEDAVKGVKYYCIECGCEMIYCNGEKIKGYFRHKNTSDYYNNRHNQESYLHKISKLIYLNKMQSGYFPIKVLNLCSKFNDCCFSSDLCERDYITIDLMKYYDVAGVEKGYNGYIADILLKHKRNDSYIMFEVFVTHKSTEQKCRDCTVVEVEIKSDDDIGKIPTLVRYKNDADKIHFTKCKKKRVEYIKKKKEEEMKLELIK